MKTTRRAVLLSGAAVLALRIGGQRQAAAQTGPRNLVLCLTGISAATPADMLDRATALFLSRGIPVTAALALTDQDDAPVFRLATAIALREAGLFEIAVEVEGPHDPWRYFQMRRAADLRNRIRTQLDSAQGLPIVTVLASAASGIVDLGIVDLAAYRSAGFLALVQPGLSDRSASFAATGMEQVALTGGAEGDPATPDDQILAGIDAMLSAESDCLLALRLPASGDLPPVWRQIAERLGAALDSGALYGTRPSDLVQQLSRQPPFSLAVLLQAGPDDQTPDSPIGALMHEMDRLDLPYTVGAPAGSLPDQTFAAGSCTWAAAETVSAADCVVLDQTAASASDQNAPWRIAIATGSAAAWSGMSDAARLIIPAVTGEDNWRLDAGVAPTGDRLLLVTSADIPTQVDRLALAESLAALRDEGQAKLFTVAEFANHLTAPDPILDRFQAARRLRQAEPPDPAPLTPADANALLEDARLAWRYIERMTHPDTGLCAGAAHVGATGQLVISNQATMWDIASQIQGIVAASQLGLLAADDAALRIEKILNNIPIKVIDGLRLPPLFVKTDRRAVFRSGFDFCDTGRFLIALDTAVMAGLLPPTTAAAFFANLDLSATLRDGRPFSHGRSGWSDGFANHCTPYLARGLAKWGLAIASPYPALPETPTGDDRMRLLYSIAQIGAYGTEPPLLEATELGPSPTTRCMTDVLFDAQLQSFETTGRLKCVSETSLNMKPWFAYQGLRVDQPGEAGWVIRTGDPDPQYATDTFLNQIEAISSKAAFLWAAHYPHPYSARLLAVVRSTARVPDLGFSVGVFVRDGAPMQGYSDINTNGVILSAIAYTLRKTG